MGIGTYDTGLKSTIGDWGPFTFEDDNELKTYVQPIQGLQDEIYVKTISNALTQNECKLFMKMSEEFVYSESPSTTEFFRQSPLLITDIPSKINNKLSHRILPYLPKKITIDNIEWKIYPKSCSNPRWRFNKYVKSCHFKPQ